MLYSNEYQDVEEAYRYAAMIDRESGYHTVIVQDGDMWIVEVWKGEE
jgi:hypothetical protein